VRIGILAQDFITWSGGVDFLRTVTDSLLAAPRSQTAEFHLLIPDSGLRLRWRRIRRRTKHIFASLFNGNAPAPEHGPSRELISESFAEFRDRIAIHHIDIGRRALTRATRQLRLDAVLPALHSLGANFPRPWVAYAYDFQHKYFPQNFSPNDCRSRDEHFEELLSQAKAVIVNSQAAAGDIAEFVPHATARVFALPFAPAPSRDWLEDRPEILARYQVVRPFFIISNQFWMHKGHDTAFEAFRLVAAQHSTAMLVCTGSTAGSSDATFFPRLMARLQEGGLDQRVRMLGLIPKRDQIELLKHACAVIQPTLFEGGPGGGAVYDAVSLDVPAIVSDIAVNREVTGAAIEFFRPGDISELAQKMQQRLKSTHKKASAGELVETGKRRRAACGEVLWCALDFVV
jgi:glycosyltransferase involved in cell wall biosynthesis